MASPSALTLQVDLDAVGAGDRRANGGGGVLDHAAGGIVQPAVGDRPRGQPVGRSRHRSGHFEQGLDLDGGIERQRRDADRRARVLALVAEDGDHQVGSAVHHLRAVEEARRGIDEAAEPHHPRDLVEIAEAALTWASRLIAQARAAFWPSSTETSAPSLPLATSLPSSRQIWPDTISKLPVRTNGT